MIHQMQINKTIVNFEAKIITIMLTLNTENGIFKFENVILISSTPIASNMTLHHETIKHDHQTFIYIL